MERQLFILTTPGAILTATMGFSMMLLQPAYFLSLEWMRIKLALVAVLMCYHRYAFVLLVVSPATGTDAVLAGIVSITSFPLFS